MSEPDMSKKILNLNIGVNNIIPKKDVKTIMIDTLQSMSDILANHCGPYAKNAMLAPQVHMGGNPKFTMDGINIISSIEYANPLQDIMQKILVHIGTRIDLAGKDGTTSSMMIIINALKYMISNLPSHVTYGELVSSYNAFTKEVLMRIDEYALKLDLSNPELIYDAAYNQALTSSHNNERLSRTVAELFSSTAKESWSYVSFERSAYETDTVYELKVDTDNYKLKCNPMNQRMIDGADGISSKEITGDLYVMSDSIVDNAIGFKMLQTEVLKAVEENKALTIVCPTQCSVSVREWFEGALHDYERHKVKIYMASLEGMHQQHTDFKALKLMSGKHYDSPAQQYEATPNITTKFVDGYLSINGFYESTDSGLCPFVDNEEYYMYNEMMRAIGVNITNLQNSKHTEGVNEKLLILQSLYNRMLLDKTPRILIGGMAYDNTEAVDVCIDTLGATRTALLKGRTYGGMWTLRRAVSSVDNSSDNALIELCKNAFLHAISILHQATIAQATTQVKDKSKLAGLSYEADEGCFDVATGQFNKNITQPIEIDKEVIRRFGDVAIKYVMTDKVIVPHSVYKPDEQ